MIQPEAQGAEATVRELAPVIEVVYPALEAAVQKSRDFFPDDAAIDTALFPNLVRYFVKCSLETRGLKAVDDDTPTLEHTVLPNNGLYLEYGSRHIRIRKADKGGVPSAVSATLQAFYQQDSLFGEAIEMQNLLLLWDMVDGVVELQLACPKSCAGVVYWSTPIEHPAHLHEAPPAEPVEDFDLPISLPEASSDDE